MDFVKEIYLLTQKFPKEEQFGLTNQLRRAAVSIPLNIAEGSGGSSNTEFIRFLEISRRSVYEVMTALELACRLGYATAGDTERLAKEADEIAAMLTGLIKSQRNS